MTSIIFFGTGPVAAASLKSLRDSFTIEAVVTKPRAAGHKGEVPVEELAQKHNIPLHFASHKAHLDTVITDGKFTSEVGVVVDFGIIISQAVIDSFKFGIVNSHFSLLPQWRGADPITYSILSGQEKTGVSLMVIDAGMDTGKLITYRSLPIEPKDTTGSLTERLISLSGMLLQEFLPKYLSGEVTPKNQPHPDRATYSHKIHKADANIDWHESAEVIERRIRAYQPWPKARTRLGSVECIILDADIVRHTQLQPKEMMISNGSLILGCGKEALSLRVVQPLGKKEMPVQAFLFGYKSKLV